MEVLTGYNTMWHGITDTAQDFLSIGQAILVWALPVLVLCPIVWSIQWIKGRFPQRIAKKPLVSASAKGRIAGAVWIVVVCLIGCHMMGGNPLNELALIRHSVVAPGFITEAWEDAESGDQGVQWFHTAVYTYRLTDGRELTEAVHGNGRLKDEFADLREPFPVEVEYLPGHPTVSRIKGGGCQTVTEWLWRKVGLGSLLLVVFAIPGIALLLGKSLE